MGFFCGDQVLACVGALHPQLLQSLKIKERLYYADFAFETLFARTIQKNPHYQPVSALPPVYRDMALVVAQSVTHQNIVETIHDIKPDFLTSISLFDVYTGDNLPAGKKSLAYSMVYEPKTTSLTDEQVNTIHFELVEKLKTRLGAELR
jgi:phenylalanyl-tRNA synthetase beta chain